MRNLRTKPEAGYNCDLLAKSKNVELQGSFIVLSSNTIRYRIHLLFIAKDYEKQLKVDTEKLLIEKGQPSIKFYVLVRI